MTIFECYNQTKKMLKAAGVPDEVFEAKQLIKFITKMNNAEILANYTASLDKVQEALWTVTVKQRCTRYPLQYILGEWDFYGMPFYVGEGCLAPRADTEVLVSTANEWLIRKPDAKVLDLCAGSGCIGVTVAKKNPKASVTLVEKYDVPYTYLNRNIKRHETENATAVLADIFTYQPNEKFDLILSNPPYISSEEMSLLNEEAKMEPTTALFGGEDGLDFYRHILKEYKQYLNQGGALMVEIGFSQGEAVKELFTQNGFINVQIKNDYQDNQRVVFGTLG